MACATVAHFSQSLQDKLHCRRKSPTNFSVELWNGITFSRREMSCDESVIPEAGVSPSNLRRSLDLKQKINFNGREIHPRRELSASKFRTWRPSPVRHSFRAGDRSLPQTIALSWFGGLTWLRLALQSGFPSVRRAYCGPCSVLWKQVPLRRISGPSFPERFPRWSLERTDRTHRMAENQRQKWHFFLLLLGFLFFFWSWGGGFFFF